MPARAFFYDTWAFMALANAADPDHAVSVEADRRLEDAGYTAVTSDYIFDETLTGLHVTAGARVALTFADLLLARCDAGDVLLAEVTAPRRASGVALFRRLGPKVPRLSFTDCASFAVMRELDIRIAFTVDRHFHQAGGGIRPLLERRGRSLVIGPT